MQQSEIIKKIIIAEHEATEMVRQAKEKRAGLNEDIADEIEGMRTFYMLKANDRVDLVETQERSVMEERLAALERKSLSDIGHIDEMYRQNRETWIARLFDMITGVSDGND